VAMLAATILLFTLSTFDNERFGAHFDPALNRAKSLVQPTG
jgi:hypothetical protein